MLASSWNQREKSVFADKLPRYFYDFLTEQEIDTKQNLVWPLVNPSGFLYLWVLMHYRMIEKKEENTGVCPIKITSYH